MRNILKYPRRLAQTGNRGFTVVELIITLAIIGTLLTLVTVGAAGFIKNARRSAANADARQIYIYACSELLSESSALCQYLSHIKPTAPFKVPYNGLADNCHTTSDVVLIDKLKRGIIVQLPGVEKKGFRLYLITDDSGQYQISKVVVFTDHPEYANNNDNFVATGCYPLESYEKIA